MISFKKSIAGKTDTSAADASENDGIKSLQGSDAAKNFAEFKAIENENFGAGSRWKVKLEQKDYKDGIKIKIH
jgi:hypothetical protein